jgi:hypothetical protein
VVDVLADKAAHSNILTKLKGEFSKKAFFGGRESKEMKSTLLQNILKFVKSNFYKYTMHLSLYTGK